MTQKLGHVHLVGETDDLMATRGLIESGQIEPVIDRTYPLGDLATAIRYLVEGHARGRVIITVQDPDRG